MQFDKLANYFSSSNFRKVSDKLVILFTNTNLSKYFWIY